ncbi:MAG: DNA polymerase III subunit [Phycisphaerae bacterium]|nr:DNA polymerase III subunit [Phycisphaerae bacterium]
MRLTDVRHQDRAISILRRALRSGRTHHAYLFDGPEGVGKELTARGLAARLLCGDESLEPDADACGRCPSCKLLATGNHLDFHLIHRGLHKFHPDSTIRSSKGLFLSVNLIRHFLIEPAGMKPTQGPRRVFLIRDAERMNEEAQNALLKTLEEPPGSACLILVTASASRLLPTIRSRCQRVPFGLLPPDFVAGELEARLGLSAANARALASLAGGRLGVALLWHRIGLLDALDAVGGCVDRLPAGDPEAFGKTLVELATELALRTRQQADEEAPAEAEEGTTKSAGKIVSTDELRTALKLVMLLVASLYREALVVKSGAAALCSLAGQQPRVEQLAAGTTLDRLDECIRGVNEAERTLDRNVMPQLVCERLAVALLGELPVSG